MATLIANLILFATLFIIAPINSIDAQVVSGNPALSPGVTGGNTSSVQNSLYSEGGNGTTKDQSYHVYVPMRAKAIDVNDNGNTSDNASATSPDESEGNTRFFLYTSTSTGTDATSNLPYYTSTAPTGGGTLQHNLKLTPSVSTDTYLSVGVQDPLDGNHFILLTQYSTVLSAGSTAEERTAAVDLFQLCTRTNNCSPVSTAAVTKTIVEVPVYFFLTSSNTLSLGTSYAYADFPKGAYFKYLLSNQVDGKNLSARLDDLQKGDGLFTAFYHSSFTLTNMKEIIALSFPATSLNERTYFDAISSGSATIQDRTSTVQFPGQFDVKNLTNEVAYNISIAIVNKWNFVTLVSPTTTQTAQSIETFLKKKNCFLISAGFKRDHYVLDFYRDFRDQILLKNSFGKAFVNSYYRLSYPWALKVYHSKFFSAVVVSLAYLGYFVLHKGGFFLFLLFIPIFIFIKKKRILQ